MSPKNFTRLVAVSWVLLFLIVLTGAAVRLTDSGLGCEDWPTCDEDSIIEEWNYHSSIEFGNRLVSIVIGLVCVATAIAAHFRDPKRRDLIVWSWAIVVGVVIQAIIGRFSVTTHLNPWVVGVHFLGSPVLLWMSIVLWIFSTKGPARAEGAGPVEPVNHSRAVVALAALILWFGTLVTGTGPNGGDARADRLGFNISDVARLHAVTVWIFLATLLALVWRLWRRAQSQPEPVAALGAAFGRFRWLVIAAAAQGAIGYYQYWNGVPPAVVEVHIFGSMVVWCLAVWAHLTLFDPLRSRSDG